MFAVSPRARRSAWLSSNSGPARSVVAGREREVAEVVERERGDPLVTDVARKRDGLLQHDGRPLLIAAREHDRTEVAERVGDEPELTGSPRRVERPLGERGRRPVVALEERNRRRGRLHAAQEQRILAGRRGQHGIELTSCLGEVTTDVPEPAQQGGQAQSLVVLSRLGEVRERRPRVVVLRLEGGEPPRLVFSAQLRLGPFDKCEVPLRVTAPGRVRIELLQTLRGVLPHGLEQVVPRLAFGPSHEEE